MQANPQNRLCLHFVYTGNCINRSECIRNHPDLKMKTKKKLQFDKKKDFVPDKTVIQQIASTVPQFVICACCKGRPFGCKGTQFCLEFGKCICIGHAEMEAVFKLEGGINEEFCKCCMNDFFNCPAMLCKQLGMCQCQMREEMEPKLGGNEEEEIYAPEYSDCSCCHGYIYSCGNPMCSQTGACFCLL